nr:unnamed protein product [Callosobruchus chinensis]
MDLGMLATFIIKLTIVILKIGLLLRMVHTRKAWKQLGVLQKTGSAVNTMQKDSLLITCANTYGVAIAIKTTLTCSIAWLMP